MKKFTGDCSIDCLVQCAYPGQFSECDVASIRDVASIPVVVARRVRDGHLLESDPPAAMTAAERWTCKRCGRAVIRYGSNIYGSATDQECVR